MLIDDFSSQDLTSNLGTKWQGISDSVMGGVSKVNVTCSFIGKRPSLILNGDVLLENNGGFIQASLNLAMAEGVLDASTFLGIRLVVRGNYEQYSIHLRTPDNIRSWQSYRAQFTATPSWETIDLPFSIFIPHRHDIPIDTKRLRRIGIVAIGRAFYADLAVAKVSFFF
jgi:hypothetical protein